MNKKQLAQTLDQLPVLFRWGVVRHVVWTWAGGNYWDPPYPFPGRRCGNLTYLLYAPVTGRIKIGRTTHLNRRLSAIRRQAGVSVELLARIYSHPRMETDLHRCFLPECIEHEWFEPCPDLWRLVRVVNGMSLVDPPVSPLALPSPQDQREGDKLLNRYPPPPPRLRAPDTLGEP